VQRLNDVRNAPRASGPTPEEAPEYKNYRRLLELLRELERRNAVSLEYEVYPSQAGPTRLILQFTRGALTYPETRELIGLLKLAPASSITRLSIRR
jgi:hypothetical protein